MIPGSRSRTWRGASSTSRGSTKNKRPWPGARRRGIRDGMRSLSLRKSGSRGGLKGTGGASIQRGSSLLSRWICVGLPGLATAGGDGSLPGGDGGARLRVNNSGPLDGRRRGHAAGDAPAAASRRAGARMWPNVTE
eukprot:3444738-Pyramimonas_sp.AAC.1